MPYETVQEKVVREKRVRVCARCRNPIPDSTTPSNRRVYHTAGSLGTSLGGSILLGSVLGPVGAIGGAIAGSIAGAKASDKVCDAVEDSKSQGELCEACQALASGGGSSGDGGHRLGSGEPIAANSEQPPPAAGERIKEGAQMAGQKIGSGFQWMKQSVNSAIENAKQPKQQQQQQQQPSPPK